MPFTADQMLANADHALFGTDPWRLLQWLRPLFGYYFWGWVCGICIAAVHLAMAPESGHKRRVLIVFFTMFTFAGPLFHLLLPAGGPIFYDLLGYGDRFAALPLEAEVLEARNYLWKSYQAGLNGSYAGISAMPSLHVAFAAWVALSFWRTLLFPLAVGHAILILLLSVATGWHYALDGIVSIALVAAIYAVLAIRAPAELESAALVPQGE